MTIVRIPRSGKGERALEYVREPGGCDFGVLFIVGASQVTAADRALFEGLTKAGMGALMLPIGGPEEIADRSALADIEAALLWMGSQEELDERSLAVVGRGHGGTLAFMTGCTSRRVAAIVSVAGPVEYESLSAQHPTQPIELFLNLDRPFLLVRRTDDGLAMPADQEERLESRLRAGSKAYEFLIQDVDGAQIVRFLKEVL